MPQFSIYLNHGRIENIRPCLLSFIYRRIYLCNYVSVNYSVFDQMYLPKRTDLIGYWKHLEGSHTFRIYKLMTYNYVAVSWTWEVPLCGTHPTLRPVRTSASGQKSWRTSPNNLSPTVRIIWHNRGGSRIFEKGGVHLRSTSKKKRGGPGGGPTLDPMLKSLIVAPKKGGPDPLDPPSDPSMLHNVMLVL